MVNPATESPSRVLDGLIIGGGISGLALAFRLGLDRKPGTWQLWEASDRVGGTIGTDRDNGYSVDWGPNGFLDREPLTLRLVDEIGLREALEPANDNSGNRFIVKNGRLHSVPLTPLSILTTGLLSFPAKLRLFAEPFIPARRDDADESVYDFTARRIGRAAAETFVDPMVSGVFGGVAKQLSLSSCFPVMREMETRYGGLVKAMIAKKRAARQRRRQAPAKQGSGGPAGPGGRLTSFHGGLDVITDRLHQRLKNIIRLNRAVAEISRDGDSWLVSGHDGQRTHTRRVVVACPTYVAAGFFRDFDPDLSDAFAAIPYAPIIVIATGHRREDIAHPLDGFGFLVPRTQGLRSLGSIWTSSIFSERAPAGHVQFRSMLGGAGDPSVLELSDNQLWETVRREIGPLIGLKGDPVLMRIYRWQRGIPQFTLGHQKRRQRLETLAAKHPGLHMVGNAYYGVGLNDCIKTAFRVAQQING